MKDFACDCYVYVFCLSTKATAFLVGNGPLAEIDFWRDRNGALSALVEQLKHPKISQILELYASIDNAIEYRRSDLNKYHTEAKDNVRFLSTLERHFKNITHGASFHTVIDILPSMMNALRMVWIISRHYNRDERMVPLMERIAWVLAERVAKVIHVPSLFKLVLYPILYYNFFNLVQFYPSIY